MPGPELRNVLLVLCALGRDLGIDSAAFWLVLRGPRDDQYFNDSLQSTLNDPNFRHLVSSSSWIDSFRNVRAFHPGASHVDPTIPLPAHRV